MTSVYSFSDVSLVLSHPSVGLFTFNGEGLGSVGISYGVDNTVHDVAADGSVMISKVIADNGSMAINIQQTSEAQLFLKKWYNYIKAAPTSEWARASAVLRIPATNETYNMSNVSPQKRPDESYQQTGQQVAWNLLCGKITENG